MDKKEVINQCLNISGWMSESELDWIYSNASRVIRWVEVGVYQGRSFNAVLHGLPYDGIAYAVDDFRGVEGQSLAGYPLMLSFITNIKDAPIEKFCLLYCTSFQAAQHLSRHQVDVVFIDGNHDYQSVYNDIVTWLPRVKNGGMLCGHDESDKGVRRALEKLLPDYRKEVGSIWSWQK